MSTCPECGEDHGFATHNDVYEQEYEDLMHDAIKQIATANNNSEKEEL